MVMSGDGMGDAPRTLGMTVQDVGFLVDRIGQDCGPLQFLRELTHNCLQAVVRTAEGRGEVIWDVDWAQYEETGVRKLCVIDTGIGMTGPEMAQYINKLSSSVHEQSAYGNYGVGAKIAGATRNPAGMIYMSWVDGEGWMVHLWRDPATGQYGLRQFPLADGSYAHYVRIDESRKPSQIGDHGTVVVLLGDDPEADTMQALQGAASPSRWVARYLNTRYYRIPEGVTVRAREGWDRPRTDQSVNVLRRVQGQEAYLMSHSECSGSVPVSGATVWWWILKDDKAISQNAGSIASGGHVAALHKAELYEMLTGVAGIARLQQFGIIFGHQRVVIYVEPNGNVVSNTARTHLLVGGESLPWTEWAAEFRRRDKMPEEIQRMMEEASSGSDATDHKKAIRDRLRQIRDLFTLSLYKRCVTGTVVVKDVVETAVLTEDTSRIRERDDSRSLPQGSATPRPPHDKDSSTDKFLRSFVLQTGVTATEVVDDQEPEVKWTSASDGTRTPADMEDRAAKYLYEANTLLVNADFRGFRDMVDRWLSRYPDTPGARPLIEDTVREWYEQALVETVLGIRSLYGSRCWSEEDIGNALSEEALTASVMQRYHVDTQCKKVLACKLGQLQGGVERVA